MDRGRQAAFVGENPAVAFGMRIFLVATVLALTASLACRDGSKNRQPAEKKNAAFDPRTRSPFQLDTGHTIARGESRYAVIQNDSCPGIRIANTRFEATRGLIVRITEDNSQLECTEGIVDRPLVLVWKADQPNLPPDTIRAAGARISLLSGGTNSHTIPLLDGVQEVGGIGPTLHAYYSLLNGRLLFVSEPPIFAFVANGTRRYVSVRGGDGDTAAVIAYGSGAATPEVLRILSDSTTPWGHDPILSVDTASMDGPMRNGEIVIGPDDGKDSLAVSGITLRFRVGDVSTGFTPDDAKVDYVVRIENDRLTLVKK
jgi:hypothetical protein